MTLRSPAQAIAWEICAKNRWALIFAFGLIPFCALASQIIPPGYELVNVMYALSGILTFTSLIWVCSYTANDSRGAFSGFPSWMYTLPLRTSWLVICPMLLGTLLTLLAVAAWEITIRAHWRLPLEATQLGWHALLAVAALTFAQSIIWSLHRFRWIRVVALVAAMMALLYVGLVGHVWKFTGGAGLWFGGVALSIPLAVGAAIAGVERDRQGRWEGWTSRLVERLLDLLPRRSGRFASAARAQFWFEWRRKGWFMVAVLGVPMALSMCLLPLSAMLYLDPVATLFHFSGPFVLMILLAGALGGPLAKSDPWSVELGLHPLVASKPRPTADLVFAKMKCAAAVTCLGWLLFCILLVPVMSIRGFPNWESLAVQRFWVDFPLNYPKFWHWLSHPVVILALVTATWHTIVQTMAVVLTGDKRRTMANAWQGIVVMSAVAGCAVWLYKDRSKVGLFLHFLPWLTAAVMTLKAIGMVRAFLAARALVSRRDFFVLLAVWVFVAALVLTAGLLAHSAHGMPAALLWLLVLWQFFPAGEIPACVVALHQNRHR